MDPNSNLHKIYALIDPRNNEVKYIGCTIQPLKRRLYRHLKSKSNIRKYLWVKDLELLGKRPIIKLIETVNEDEWQSKETHYIAKYRQLGDLYNVTDGGSSSLSCNSLKRLETSGFTVGRPVICVETGEIYENASAASIMVNIHHTSISRSVRTGCSVSGTHWKLHESNQKAIRKTKVT